MIVVDTVMLYAAADRDDPDHAACAEVLADSPPVTLLSPRRSSPSAPLRAGVFSVLRSAAQNRTSGTLTPLSETGHVAEDLPRRVRQALLPSSMPDRCGRAGERCDALAAHSTYINCFGQFRSSGTTQYRLYQRFCTARRLQLLGGGRSIP